VQSNGPTWNNKQNWCDNKASMQDWFGVGLNKDGNVVNLNLQQNGIALLYPSIHRLSALRGVNLQGNPLDARSIAEMVKSST
jgi:hypothetical protein